MKLKLLFSIFILFQLNSFSQSSLRDSLQKFTRQVVIKAMERGNIKKLAVWDFTDMNKEVSLFGSYIAEQFSVYAENVDGIEIMDRQNLKSILKEHKLKSEGFIDQSSIMELGKFNEVGAVAVGSVIMADKNFQVVVKIIETSLGRTIAAAEEFFPIDKNMAAILGLEFQETATGGTSNNTATPNRGYNRPLNSNEQYNNSSTVNADCKKNNTGDYCFYNSTIHSIRMVVYTADEEGRIDHYGNNKYNFNLKPGESKCIYNILADKNCEYLALTMNEKYVEGGDNYNVERFLETNKGIFIVEKCKSKTYTLK